MAEDEATFEQRSSRRPRKTTVTQPEQGSIKVPATSDDEVTPAAGDEEEIAKADQPIGRWVARKKSNTASGPAFPEVAQTWKKSTKRVISHGGIPYGEFRRHKQ